MSNQTKQKLDVILKQDNLCNDESTDFFDALGETILDTIITDDENPEKIGRFLAKAYVDNNLDDALMAICGWSMKSLVCMAQERCKQAKG